MTCAGAAIDSSIDSAAHAPKTRTMRPSYASARRVSKRRTVLCCGSEAFQIEGKTMISAIPSAFTLFVCAALVAVPLMAASSADEERVSDTEKRVSDILSRMTLEERSEERRVGKEGRSKWS